VLADKIEDEDLADIARKLRGNAEGVAGFNDTLKDDQEAVEHDPGTDSVVALDALVERVVAEAGGDATVEVDVPDGLAVRADDHLETALSHHVANSVEYAGEDPDITVSARQEGNHVVCTVADDGPGIPAIEREVVLGERDIARLEHGTGLGLWTVRAITESYGGEMSTRSEDGAAVDLRLPAA
jgi:two-component system OmpR family sensor kinase